MDLLLSAETTSEGRDKDTNGGAGGNKENYVCNCAREARRPGLHKREIMSLLYR